MGLLDGFCLEDAGVWVLEGLQSHSWLRRTACLSPWRYFMCFFESSIIWKGGLG